MPALILCFVAGLTIGIVGCRVARKLYWHSHRFAPLHRRYTRRRFSRYGFRRARFFLRPLLRGNRGEYAGDYRLSKLLEKLELKHDD
jgi:hypothetical protein